MVLSLLGDDEIFLHTVGKLDLLNSYFNFGVRLFTLD